MYNNLYMFNIKKSQWSLIQAPNGPPPRTFHQSVFVSRNGGELWVFGLLFYARIFILGEFYTTVLKICFKKEASFHHQARVNFITITTYGCLVFKQSNGIK